MIAGATSLRRIAEVLARSRMVRRRLPNGVAIYVTPDSQLGYLRSRLDDRMLRIAWETVTPSSVVWDIGANCGVFAFGCAGARSIVAVEPDPFLCHVVQRSMALNGVAVGLVAAAASSAVGLAEFSIAARGRASNHLTRVGGRSQAGGERARILVPTITLDGLLDVSAPPTLLKIDVEGAEVDVLRGARRVLSEARPAIHLEVDLSTESDCRAILEAADYDTTALDEMNWFCVPRRRLTAAA